MKKFILLVLVAILLHSGSASSQVRPESGGMAGTTWTGARGSTAPSVSQLPPASLKQNESAETVPLNPQTVGVDFRSIAYGGSTQSLPPDCAGGVGPSQIVVCTNDTIRTYTKGGTADGGLYMTTAFFFSPVSDPAHSVSIAYPHVMFDRLSQRWFIVMANYYSGNKPNRIMIAVSSGTTITSNASFTFYEFEQDSVGGLPNSDTAAYADYPTLAVDAHALYIGVDIVKSSPAYSFVGSTAFVVRKSSVLSGGPIVVTAFRKLGTSSLAGPWAPQGVTNDDTVAAEGYFIGVDVLTHGLLQIRRISDPGGTPGISGNLALTVPATNVPKNVPAKGSSPPLSALDDRLSMAMIKNGSLWTSHAIAVNSSGVADTSVTGRDGVRFYEIKNLTTTPTLNQSGTLYSSAASNPPYFWNPSIAISGQGHVAIGCSYAGANDYPGIAYAGRLSADGLGSVQAPTVSPSSFAYNLPVPPGATAQRWGNFSTTSVDPNDNMTMWTVQEYSDNTNSFGVRVTQLKAPPPPVLSNASPDSVLRGSSHVNVVVTGMSTGGSGFYDPGAGFPRRISGTVNGGGVIVNSIAVTDPTHLTLNISVDSGTVLGGRSVTIMNPDSQSVSSATGLLVIKGPPTTTLDVPISINWNLVSNPMSGVDDSTKTLFPGAAGPAYAYDHLLGYQISPRLQNGAGYWLKFKSAETAAITGYPITLDSVPVNDGWNLIGSLGQAVPSSSIASSPAGMITSHFFAYAGGYAKSDTIKPGRGYWVKVNGAGWLILSSSGATAVTDRIRTIATSEIPPPPPDETVYTTLFPGTYSLGEAYPNPFNPSTTIRYELPTDSHVSLRIFNPLGQIVTTLTNKIEPAGYKQAEWNASGFASGVYFYRLEATSATDPGRTFTQVRKMLLIR